MEQKPGGRKGLSKSRLLSYRQCAKRLWLETYWPELREQSPDAERRFADGNKVGEMARRLYGPGWLIEPEGGLPAALAETRQRVSHPYASTLFEATFDDHGLLVRADVLRPVCGGYQLIEVKSSTAAKEPHIDDLAVQVAVLRAVNLPISSYALAHVDASFIYAGGGDYHGLLKEADVSVAVEPLCGEVPRWVEGARAALSGPMPVVEMGAQCDKPYPCPFTTHCAGPQPEFPLSSLPRIRREQVEHFQAQGFQDIREIPEGVLSNPNHIKVWRATITGAPAIAADLATKIRSISYPRYYLDFETIQFAVPIWAGTRPYEQLPFQWSCHIEQATGGVSHREYLATGDQPPMREFAERLVAMLDQQGAIVVYSSFEQRILRELAERYSDLRPALQAIIARIEDLLPILRDGYYHPAMNGSWSIKKVLPTVAPELRYDDLEGVKDGGQAQEAFAESLQPTTSAERRDRLRSQLLRYCERDTEAMLVLAKKLSA